MRTLLAVLSLGALLILGWTGTKGDAPDRRVTQSKPQVLAQSQCPNGRCS